MEGIETEDGDRHKVAFANDVKVFLTDVEVELKKVYELRNENVCQVLGGIKIQVEKNVKLLILELISST